MNNTKERLQKNTFRAPRRPQRTHAQRSGEDLEKHMHLSEDPLPHLHLTNNLELLSM